MTIVTVSTTLALLATTAVGAEPSAALGTLLGPAAAAGAPALLGRALDTFLGAETAYQEGRYAAALADLEALWADVPPAADPWQQTLPVIAALTRSPGLNIGRPPCYYALRMLTDCARWRVAAGSAVTHQSAPQRAVLTVVLVGQSTGLEPRTRPEAEAGGGVPVEHRLAAALLADRYRVLEQSLWLFREYLLASTAGRLGVETRVVHLPAATVRVACRLQPHRHAGLAEDAAAVIARLVPAADRASTDWWWLIYPSHVPEQHPDFARTEFITGGMGGGPDGASPLFIIDDRWLLRKPPHIGFGPYTDVERRAYLPQWLQHEFFHHLFRIYPEFGLEDQSHQWFDRRTWPADFVGRFEPDYYYEALHKRLLTPQAAPPLHIALRYALPPADLYAQVPLQTLVGSYRHRPTQNDWHRGSLSIDARDAAGQPTVLRWRNAAGRSWRLFAGAEPGLLTTAEDNPYYASNPDTGRTVRIVLARDPDGAYLPQAAGFLFQGGLYQLEPPPAAPAAP
ncbi:MAG: hypothetical protein IT204_25325 [Fimbriimonadaceae bacterium]|nr:hypothetical protein [Fimbriimonadaceae bacterium]